jgi:hypothetical protein
VKGFGNYLLFYMPRTGETDAVRVFHAAQDIDYIFRSEET